MIEFENYVHKTAILEYLNIFKDMSISYIYLLMDFENLHRTATSPGTAIPLATCQMMIQTCSSDDNLDVIIIFGDNNFECNCAFFCLRIIS